MASSGRSRWRGAYAMYGKFFSCTFTGSMYGAGSDVFAVWGHMIANTVESVVELKMLAPMLGTSLEGISKRSSREN